MTATWSGVWLFEIGDHRGQHVGAVDGAALAEPVDVAEPALRHQLARIGLGQRREVDVRKMRQNEHQELPIKIPAANTKAPPTITWNAAESSGVSM